MMESDSCDTSIWWEVQEAGHYRGRKGLVRQQDQAGKYVQHLRLANNQGECDGRLEGVLWGANALSEWTGKKSRGNKNCEPRSGKD